MSCILQSGDVCKDSEEAPNLKLAMLCLAVCQCRRAVADARRRGPLVAHAYDLFLLGPD